MATTTATVDVQVHLIVLVGSMRDAELAAAAMSGPTRIIDARRPWWRRLTRPA